MNDEGYAMLLLQEILMQRRPKRWSVQAATAMSPRVLRKIELGRYRLSYPQQLLLESLLPLYKVDELRARWKSTPPRPTGFWDRIVKGVTP